jgi:hypothetical protein
MRKNFLIMAQMPWQETHFFLSIWSLTFFSFLLTTLMRHLFAYRNELNSFFFFCSSLHKRGFGLYFFRISMTIAHKIAKLQGNRDEYLIFKLFWQCCLFKKIFNFLLLYYSYVHTMLGSFLHPTTTPSLTIYPSPSLSPPPPR